ncbi:FAD-containing monooxygenase EthA [Cytospora mali]|uniref:FAD-containing monooxygenase EthA n=1 Tax=Cytospora mali TaxID=578113 RepID=A0A194VJQ0_CYTMA|nr:FAD-containing monooxygenase EthA [Valsa mali]
MSRRRHANPDAAAAPAASAPPGEPLALDVIIIGAGLTGINMAYRLQTGMPHLSFTVLEARGDIGGTWDVFRYPGVRSDSDMYTFGFAWHPWRHKLLGDGDQILSYMHECVLAYGLDKRLHFRHKVVAADWSSKKQRWTIQVDHDGQSKTYVAKWLVLSPGYFDHNKPLPAVIPGIDNFQGRLIHPQFWPADYDYTDKKIVIIGSGATAVTMLPALAKTGAKHVTMLQRSPSYIVSIPIPDNKPTLFARHLPAVTFNWLRRMSWNFTMWTVAFMCAHFPSMVRNFIAAETRKQLPAKTPFDPHFVPAYNPWDQRMCYCPDGDFFRALHTEKADVVTGTIKSVTANGIELEDGTTLGADIIVTATGFSMHFAGGIPISVDNEAVVWPNKLVWNGCMVQDVPNLFFIWGYTNASWTMGGDETALIARRLLEYMGRQGTHVAVPKTPSGFQTKTQTIWKLSSTYVLASEKNLPKYGSEGPWRPRRSVIPDLMHAKWGNITKGLQFLS